MEQNKARIGRSDNISTQAETEAETTQVKETKKDEGNNPRLGIPFVLIGTLFFCVSRTLAK